MRPIYNTYPENTVLLTTICPGGKKMRIGIQLALPQPAGALAQGRPPGDTRERV